MSAGALTGDLQGNLEKLRGELKICLALPGAFWIILVSLDSVCRREQAGRGGVHEAARHETFSQLAADLASLQI